MKLLLVTPYFYPKIGGLENYAYNIALGLKKKFKWQIIVVTSNHKNKKDVVEKINGFKIYRLAFLFKLSNTPINPLWYFKIKKIIAKEKPDIINAHTPVPFISDVVSLVKNNIPYVITYHNDLVKNNFLLQIVTKLYYVLLGNHSLALADKIITTSSLYKNTSLYLKKHKRKIAIITPGVDTAVFNVKATKKRLSKNYKKTQNLLFVGNLDKTHTHKGLDYLIEAVGEIKKEIKNIKLIIIGKGDNQKNYEALAKNYDLQNHVEFLTNISTSELPAYYNVADVVVLPSINNAEGFGMTLIEAMASKKATVGTKVGGIPYVIDHNKSGLLIKPRDKNAIAKAVITILSDSKLKKRLGINGYKKVINNFTWKKQVAATNLIFHSLIYDLIRF